MDIKNDLRPYSHHQLTKKCLIAGSINKGTENQSVPVPLKNDYAKNYYVKFDYVKIVYVKVDYVKIEIY